MISYTLLMATLLGILTPHRPSGVENIGKGPLKPLLEDISGYYACKGVEAGSKPYTGVAIITKKQNVYVVQWVISDGSTFIGIGIRQGNTLTVSWALPTDKGILCGINLYKIEPGPRLVGQWATLPGTGALQHETLRFIKGLEEEE